MNIEINEPQFLIYIKIFLPIYWIPKIGQWWHKKYMSPLVYRLDEDCIVREHGVFHFSKKMVPYTGIREVSVYRGFIHQLFGGAVVKVETAGQNHGTPEISFICPSDPEGLVQEITKRTVKAKESA